MPPPLLTLTFDLEVGVGVACDLGYPCAKFRLPRPFGFRVRADVRDIRQTDDGCRSPLNAPIPPTGRGHNNYYSGEIFFASSNLNRTSVTVLSQYRDIPLKMIVTKWMTVKNYVAKRLQLCRQCVVNHNPDTSQ